MVAEKKLEDITEEEYKKIKKALLIGQWFAKEHGQPFDEYQKDRTTLYQVCNKLRLNNKY